MISKRQKEIYPALSLSKAAQTLPTPRRPAFHIPRPSRTEPRQFQPLPIPVPQLYTLLVKKKMITPVSQRTRIGPQPKDYNKDLTCEYHQGEVGYTVENCRVLRHRIQDLLDQGVLKFRIEGVINTIGVEKSDEVGITSTKIPWEPLFHELKKRGLLTVPRAPKESTEAGTCQYHPGVRDHDLQGCEEFKKEVASLPYEKTNFQARMERIKEDFEEFCEKKKEELGKLTPATPPEMSKPDPVVIQYATKEKVMLQTASVSTVQFSEKVPSVASLKVEEEVVGNLTSGLGGITRSGRCYTPEELEKRRKEIGKTMEDPAKTKVAEDEAADFLRIIKSSEYSVVKQLSKMPSHISVLALLLASESHRKALLKVLNEAYVPEDITGPSFENMVTSILVTNQLTFSDDELPPEGRGHVKALYISVKTNDRIVSRVLIDNGSALNVCPLSTLEKLDIDPTRVRVTSMVVQAFDGTRREVLGEIDLPVEVGPQVYNINFQVLKIDSPYNLLLGRPWLHTAGAVPSSLHQKMKLIIGNQLVTILAEEPISIYNDGEIPYIDGCASEEASFHSFEFVTVIHRVAAVEPRLSRAGIMVAREFVKAGFQPGQDMGLGYTPTRKDRQMAYEARRQRAAAKLRGERWPEKKMVIPHIRTTFPASAMFQVDEGDVDELALLFAEDLDVNVIITEGDSMTLPVRSDQYEEVDLENLMDEEDLKGYCIEEGTFDEDLGEEADLPNLLPHLMISRGLETLEFEVFREHEDPESHLQRYRKKMARIWRKLSWTDTATTSRRHHQATSPPPLLKKEYAGPMVEGLSIHTITREEDSTATPPTRHCQQGEEAKTWTCVPLLQRVSSSNEETRRGVQTQHRGVGNHKSGLMKGEEPREVKIGTRCTTEQKEALIALLREFHEIFAWSYQDMPGLDTDIVVHKIPLKPECKPVKQALRRMKPEVILKIKEEGGKAIEGRIPEHSNLFGLGSQHSPGPEEGWKRYNQIKMAEEDKSKTAFVTHWGTFVYDVMPFGLKNAGATYQRAMVTLFHDMIHHEIEVYVDDMIAKSRTAQDHLTDLRKLFQRLKKYQLRLNPNKCAFGVTSGKLLGFIVSGRGIEIDPCKAYCDLRASVQAVEKRREDKDVPSSYTSQSKKHPWAACWDNKTRLGRKSKQSTIFSKKFTEPETRYLLVEKTCCALAWASKKLRQYMLYYTTWLVSRMDPIKYIFEKPALTGKIARWQVLLSEFDILFVARKAIKGQAIADYLADYPSEQLELMDSEFPDEDVMTVDEDNHGRWKLYFRRSSERCRKRNWRGLELTITFADALATLASLIKLVEGDDVRPLRIETRDIPAYCVCVEECMNVEAEIDNKPWYYDIKRFIQDREYPPRATENEKKYIRRMAFQFFLSGEILYKRTHDATLLRCVDAEEANRLIQEMHAGLMGAHANGPFLARKIMRAGYYWLTMERDCIRHVQTCHKCQMYQNSKNAPPQYLHTMASPWPFSAWGMDVIGAITPKASNGHEVHTEMLITDNASNLNNRMMDQLCQQFKIQHHNSAPYRPKMNGAVEAANKNVKKILSKMTETYKDWHEHLPYALCAYRTSVRTSVVGATPYSLVIWDGSSTASRSGDPFFENPLYQRRIERAYNKKARPRTFQPGDLVLKKRNMALSDPRGKFAPSYEGPYVVKKAFSGGAIILADMDGEEFRSPINSDSVIKYHV
uniref:RNA-directed DNA polymerase n=1 Tax=Fagus sylvatica TaxID=28930 RepID=A0A2N9HMH2_FAGSY